MGDPKTEVTRTLAELEAGPGPASAEALLPEVYDELRRLAQSYLRRERPGHTLQATALVHEAYERLVDQTRVSWRGRSHFFAVGAQAMRRLLVDHARGRDRRKRGGDWQRVTLSRGGGLLAGEIDLEQVLGLDAAIAKLAELDPRASRVVELRFFAGMSAEEAARALDVSKRTVDGDWNHARAWLARELESCHAD